MHFEHGLIRSGSVEHRDYQVSIARGAVSESTLVVLPTGLGKTVVALIVVAETLQSKRGKVLFMAPTKPLVEQHTKFLREHLVGYEPVTFTGEVHPGQRSEMWADNRLVVSTPQVVENDIEEGRLDLEQVDLAVFDEAHRAVGDYSYVSIGRRYSALGKLALGMTASPGSQVSKIAEVCENLGITNVEIRSELDDDVMKYTQDVETQFIAVEMPKGMERITYLLQRILEDQVAKLRAMGFLDPKKPATTRDLLEAGNVLRARLNSGRKSFNLFKALSTQAVAMKINHALELAQTQGKAALYNYLERLAKEGEGKGGSKASRDLFKDVRFQQARTLLYGMEQEHPKFDRLESVLKSQFLSKPESKAIVFTHYRDTCELVTGRLEKLSGFRPVRFVGQASRGTDVGLNQREQKEIIEKFTRGDFNVLVATSIAEEGLDIPSTDLVVFYEPVPSEIRTIQRRGRTGRRRAGKVVVLVTRGTKDEAYFWSSRKKEMQMRKELDALKRKLRARRGLPEEPASRTQLSRTELEGMMSATADMTEKEELARKTIETKGQKSLGEFGRGAGRSPGGPTLVVSRRAAALGLGTALADAGFEAEVRDLESADVVVSTRVAAAVRTVQEFITGIENGSMLATLGKLKHEYLHPILVVQGRPEGEGEQAGNAAVYDALSSLLSEFHMPVLSTNGPSDTAAVVSSLHKQEFSRRGSDGRGIQTTLDVSSRQMFLVQGLPNVSATLAERLLKRFGSVKGIADAEVGELMEVEGIGRVIAEGIHTVLRRSYRGEGG